MQDQVAAVALALGLRREAVEMAFAPSPVRARIVACVLGRALADVEARASILVRRGMSVDQALDLVLLRAAERTVAAA